MGWAEGGFLEKHRLGRQPDSQRNRELLFTVWGQGLRGKSPEWPRGGSSGQLWFHLEGCIVQTLLVHHKGLVKKVAGDLKEKPGW